MLMARVFLSHSSANNAEAIALRDWLIGQGWDDLFLDLDPDRGLKAGERWQAALKQAAERCELVIFLVSPEWAASKWCLAEFLLAKNLNKRVFGVIVGPTPFSDLPTEMTAEWQVVDLTTGKREHQITVTPPASDKPVPVAFSKEGLDRLRIGLMQAGLDARYFAWPPENDPNRAPYRGLEPLEAQDAGIFFGRDGPTIVGLDLLRGLREAAPPRLLVILGASGAGKSSFLRAGLFPRLARESQHFLPLPVIRPERAVLSGEAGLIACLEQATKQAGLSRTRAEIRKAVESGTASVAALLDETAAARMTGAETKAKPPTPIFAIDQAEELFRAEGADEARPFLDLLRDLAGCDELPLIVVFTIRSDSYERLQTAESLQGPRQPTLLSLPPMPKGAYAEVIKGPARRLEGTKRALKIEEALVDALLTDIEEGGAKDALPLLAFTLERLYREEGGDGDLKLSEYEELGRVKGSIESAVERALKAADSDSKIPQDREARLALLRRGLIPWLAGIDPDTGSPRRRIARRSEIPAESAPLIDLLVEQRLLATDVSKDTGEVTIEPVHEALLRQWGLLQGWLNDDLAALTTLEGVKRAARDWAANAYASDWLNHAGTRLDEAEQFAGREDLTGDLSADARNYLKQCREQEETRRRERLARLEVEREEQERRVKDAEALAAANKRMAQRTGIGLLAALVLVVLAGWQWWEAGIARDRAEAETLRVTSMLEKIGDLKRSTKDEAGAMAAYEEMLANDRALAAANPDSADRQRDVSIDLEKIANIKIDAGDSAGALTLYEESLGIRRRLFEADRTNEKYQQSLSFVIEKVGDARRNLGNWEDALSAYQEMLVLDREVAAANIGDTKRQRVVSIDLNKIADLKLSTNDTDGALAAVEESLNISRHIALTAPDNIEWKRDVSISLERLGNIKSSTDDEQGALKAYEEMLAIDRGVADAEPTNLQRVREVMFSLNKVGDMRFNLNDMSGALTNYDEGLGIARMLVDKDGDNPRSPRDLATSLDKGGDVKLRLGDAKGAVAYFEESLALRKKVADADKANYQYRREVSLTLDRIGAAKLELNDIPGSLAAAEESLAIARDLAELRKDNLEAQTDLVVGLYKLAKVAAGERKDAVIDEGIQLLARLDADGKLTDDQKGWSESFNTLRTGTQETGTAGR
jgi:tetratricopeptide (TPR) repeat protein